MKTLLSIILAISLLNFGCGPGCGPSNHFSENTRDVIKKYHSSNDLYGAIEYCVANPTKCSLSELLAAQERDINDVLKGPVEVTVTDAITGQREVRRLTFIQNAADDNKFEVLKALLEAAPAFNVDFVHIPAISLVKTALGYAVKNNNKDMVLLLLQRGAKPYLGARLDQIPNPFYSSLRMALDDDNSSDIGIFKALVDNIDRGISGSDLDNLKNTIIDRIFNSTDPIYKREEKKKYVLQKELIRGSTTKATLKNFNLILNEKNLEDLVIQLGKKLKPEIDKELKETPSEKIADFDLEFISLKKENEKRQLSVKKTPNQVIYINKKGEITDRAEAGGLILVPDNDPKAQLLKNPLQDLDGKITLTRPNFDGKMVEVKKHENGATILEVVKDDVNLTKLTEEDVKKMFGDDYKDEKNRLGKGNQGSVYSVKYDGVEYALKENATEYGDMEKLQGTGGVAKIYGGFSIGGVKYMLLEKGRMSLKKFIEDGGKISDKQVKNAIINSKKLLKTQKELGIVNTDLKPDNILIDQDGNLKVIDISSERHTHGYFGKENQQLAQFFLEGLTGKKLRGSNPALHRYYEFSDDKKYQGTKVASDDIFPVWARMICTEKKLLNDCSKISGFDDLFPHLAPIFGEILDAYKKTVSDDTDDEIKTDGKYGYYKTNLGIPQFSEKPDWDGFFKAKGTIAKGFCKRVSGEPTASSIFFKDIQKDIQKKYEEKCENLTNFNFNDAKDQKFKEWITDAFHPKVTFQHIGILSLEFHVDKLSRPLL